MFLSLLLFISFLVFLNALSTAPNPVHPIFFTISLFVCRSALFFFSALYSPQKQILPYCVCGILFFIPPLTLFLHTLCSLSLCILRIQFAEKRLHIPRQQATKREVRFDDLKEKLANALRSMGVREQQQRRLRRRRRKKMPYTQHTSNNIPSTLYIPCLGCMYAKERSIRCIFPSSIFPCSLVSVLLLLLLPTPLLMFVLMSLFFAV